MKHIFIGGQNLPDNEKNKFIIPEISVKGETIL